MAFDWIRRTVAGAAFALLAASTMLAPAGSAFAQAELVDGKLPALADGFPNKPIVLIVIDEPGSTDSVFASQLAEAANRISPQPIVVEHRVDFSNFGTWEGIAWIKDQGEIASDGYISYVLTLPDAMVDLAAVDIKEMTGVWIEDLNTVIATERVPFMMHQRSDAPWGNTLDDLVKYAKENPKTVRHITGGPGGGQDAAMRVWIRHLGIEFNDIIGGSPGERALAVASGEGDITVSPVDVLQPHHDAGKITVLMGAGGTPFPAPWEGVPTAESLGMKDDPFLQTRTIATSPDVSDEHRDWLYRLYSLAAQDPDYVAKREQITAIQLVNMGPEESKTLAQHGYDVVVPIFKELGIFWEQQQ
jgi:tripartite-type tricarboxylate transporter receptor subunit TctC